MPTSSCSVTPEAEGDIRTILSASGPSGLFGDNHARAKVRYHRLAASVHPDRNAHPDAERALRRLNELWSEYVRPSGVHRPEEIGRCERYAVFNDGGRVLVVNRTTSLQGPTRASLDRLVDVLDGTPVCMLRQVGAMTIAQPDGMHSAFVCDAPDTFNDGAIMLGQIADRVPGGKLHPADLAWIAKRIIFLGGAIGSVGLRFGDSRDAECVAVVPDTHMLAVLAPFALRESGKPCRQQVIRTCHASIGDAIGSDRASERISRFLYGCRIDEATPTRDLLCEYDELLEGMFGKPKFHVMEVC